MSSGPSSSCPRSSSSQSASGSEPPGSAIVGVAGRLPPRGGAPLVAPLPSPPASTVPAAAAVGAAGLVEDAVDDVALLGPRERLQPERRRDGDAAGRGPCLRGPSVRGSPRSWRTYFPWFSASTTDANASVATMAPGRRRGETHPSLPAASTVGWTARSPSGTENHKRLGGRSSGEAARSGIRARRTVATGGRRTQRSGQARGDVTRSTTASTAARSFGDAFRALRPVEEVGQVGRQRGAHAGGPLDGVGELGRVGGGERDRGHARLAADPGRADADRGVGVDQQARCSACTERITASGRLVVEPRGPEDRGEPAGRAGPPRRPAVRPPGAAGAARRSGRRRGRSSRTAAARSWTSTWMSMLGLSVGTTPAGRHGAGVEEAGEDVVAVRTDDETVDRSSGLAGRSSRPARCRSCPVGTAKRRRGRSPRSAAVVA